MRDLSKTASAINSKIGKAINEYDLISDGDNILVAVSGGKDSMTLLTLLRKIQSWAPVSFTLKAVHITTDFSCGDCVQADHMTSYLESLGVEYFIRHVDVLNDKGETNCFWCSWNKRKAIFQLADEVGCSKIAFGHHKDDIVETMLMNLLFNGEISAMNPKQDMFKGKLTIIRPMCYVEEKVIRKFASETGLPAGTCECPFGKDSKRKYIKDFLTETQKISPKANIKTNIFNSLSRIREDYIDLRSGVAENKPETS